MILEEGEREEEEEETNKLLMIYFLVSFQLPLLLVYCSLPSSAIKFCDCAKSERIFWNLTDYF